MWRRTEGSEPSSFYEHPDVGPGLLLPRPFGTNVDWQIKEALRSCRGLSLGLCLPCQRATEDWGLCFAEESVKESEWWTKACLLWASAGLLSSLWGIEKRERGACELRGEGYRHGGRMGNAANHINSP